MNFFSLEPSGAWSSLGAAVLHFLWQGALVGCVTAGILIFIRRTASSARYAVALGGLLISFLVFSGTYLHFLLESSSLALPSSGVLPLLSTGEDVVTAPEFRYDGALIAAWCWLVGAMLMSVRFIWNYLGVRRLKTNLLSTPEASWVQVFCELKLELGVKRTVRLVASGLAEVPMVVGWLSPIVIVPAAAFVFIDFVHLRCLLVHELQHIRRHDHLINAIQVVLETILFFHPVIWWLSKQLRLEREYCCDQTAVQLTGDPKLLARALASMEALRIQQPNPDFVLAANGGPLMQRISRILGLRPERRSSFSGWQLPVGLIVAGVLATAGRSLAQPSITQDGEVATPRFDQESARQRKVRSEWLKVDAKLKALVKEGKITPEQAKARLDQYRKKIAEDKAAFQKGADRAAIEKRREAYGKKLRQAVEDGKMTADEARSKLEEARKSMDDRGTKAGEGKQEARRAKAAAEYARVEKELKELVKRGEVSPEQARDRLAGFRRRLVERAGGEEVEPQADVMITREQYVAAEKRLRKLVENGMATEAQVGQRLAEMRRRIPKRLGPAEQADIRRRLRNRFEAKKARYGEMVEEGLITEAQAKKRLDEQRKADGEIVREFSAQDQTEQARAREEYVAAEKRLRLLVKNGMATEAQVEERLAEMRKRMSITELQAQVELAKSRLDAEGRELVVSEVLKGAWGREQLDALQRKLDGGEPAGEQRRRENAVRYDAVQKELNALAKTGLITPEQAKRRLEILRRSLGEPEPRPMEAYTGSKLDAVVKRLQETVKAGKLTREEAEKAKMKLEALKKRLGEAKQIVGKKAEGLREQYKAGEARVKAAIKSGKLTPEEGLKRLNAFRKRFGGEKAADKPKKENPPGREL